MFKKLLAMAAMLLAVASFAAVEVNKATAEELDSVKGIGTKMAQKIVDERAKGAFKNWDDFIARVKGTGRGNAAKLSAAGLTVDGKPRESADAKTGAEPKTGTARSMTAAPAGMPAPAAKDAMRPAPMAQPRASEPARR